MPRGPKPAKPKLGAKPPVARKSAKDDGAKVRDLEKRLAEALRAKAEALDQQTATSEILRVISSSPTDAQPVFGVVLASGVRLCGASFGGVFRFDGELIHLVTSHEWPAEQLEAVRRHFPMPPGDGSLAARAIRDRRVVQTPDYAAESRTGLLPEWVPGGEQRPRSTIAIPMLRDGSPLGAIVLARAEPGLFSDEHIVLLKTFADQAVIAIENVRLFNESQEKNRALSESLEQQTATSEILGVISRSPTDVQPVFDAIVRSAVRLLDGLHGVVDRFDGELIHFAAQYNYTPEALQMTLRMYPRQPDRKQAAGRAILTGDVVNIADAQADPEYATDLAVAGGWRSILNVPILREGKPIGTIGVIRGQAGRFSDAQVELLRTFADQAVIAIENVRLFTELQEKNEALTQAHAHVNEALERQTATSEILGVIASSPTDVQPVYDAIVRSAVTLCGATLATVYRREGDLVHLVGIQHQHPHAAGVAAAYPAPVTSSLMSCRAILENAIIHLPDVDVEGALPPEGLRLARLSDFRSVLSVPMRREGHAIGAILVGRPVLGRFPDEQIVLLQTFADQAVIAIENVRLFTELQEKNRDLTEALNQQTATSDVLRVISQSQTDLQPVFDALIDSATKLCVADIGAITRFDGEVLRFVNHSGMSAEVRAFWQQNPSHPGRGSVTGRAALERRTIHVPDVLADSSYDYTSVASPLREGQAITGYRAALVAPMLRDGALIGTIQMMRREARPFTASQIKLLETFADQAVIAIENVRLFKELQTSNRDLTTALERQTATAEILGVIASSPTDVQPVLEAVVQNVSRLCGTRNVSLYQVEGSLMRKVAECGSPLTWIAVGETRPISRTTVSGRAILDGTTIHLPDHQSADAAQEYPDSRRDTGIRTTIGVPLLREGVAIGVFTAYRTESQSFAEREITLLQTFADQAVIAIENVRLFKELQTSNRELTTALDTQTATSDILRVISRSQTDVQPVFDAIVTSAVHLMRGHSAALTRVANREIVLAATTTPHEAGAVALRALFPLSLDGDAALAQAIRARAPINITDAQTDPRVPEALREQAQTRGYRSWATVPLLRHDEAIGTISVTRRDPGGFTDDEITLLKTFADQAVIAIENVRLFKELEARTRELTRSVGELQALSEVGQAISSTLDLQAVLSTIAARATQLSGTDAGVIYEYDEPREVFVPRATEHLEAAIVETMLATPVRKGEGATGRLAEVQEPIQVPDILAVPAESRVRGALVRAGYRAPCLPFRWSARGTCSAVSP